jgi:hypothetical protein
MTTATPTQADYERADRVHDVAEQFGKALPGFPRAVSTVTATLPELVDGQPTWDVMVEACDWTAAAKVRVVEAGGELSAALVERYTHSVGTADDVGDDYFTDFDAAAKAALARSERRHETAVIWALADGLYPAGFAFNGKLYQPAEVQP